MILDTGTVGYAREPQIENPRLLQAKQHAGDVHENRT
jgi:hypothetical protein